LKRKAIQSLLTCDAKKGDLENGERRGKWGSRDTRYRTNGKRRVKNKSSHLNISEEREFSQRKLYLWLAAPFIKKKGFEGQFRIAIVANQRKEKDGILKALPIRDGGGLAGGKRGAISREGSL